MKRANGFTIVELLVIIVVVAILATITIVSYGWLRDDAMDASIRSTASQSVKLLNAHSLKNGAPIVGGFFHMTPGSGSINVDTAVAPYAASDWRSGLKSKNVNVSTGIFKYFNCSSGGFVVFASLNNPTPEDIASYESALTSCPIDGSVVSTAPANPGTPGYQYNFAIRSN